jgi:hypothetical protein
MQFVQFRDLVHRRIKEMESDCTLLIADVDKDELWDTYLSSFSKEDNPIFRERTEHDCSTCRHFIKNVGGMVIVNDSYEIETIWSGINVSKPYKKVAKALDFYVKSKVIKDVLTVPFQLIGHKSDVQIIENETLTFNHFYYRFTKMYVQVNRDNEVKANFDVLKRSLEEISMSAIEIVDELITQNSIYRGEEMHNIILTMKKLKEQYDNIPRSKKDAFVWKHSLELGSMSKIRNTVIGTLLVDITDNVELNKAVESFEAKVAPENYKRPKPVVTKSMVKGAEKKVKELGLEDTVARRYAVSEDVSVNDVVFVNRSTVPVMKNDSVFEQLIDEVQDSNIDPKKFNKVKSVPIKKFINKIVPKATKIEMLVENRFEPNFMSLIAPVHDTDKRLFKWDNLFSWTYNKGLADASVKKRVMDAGGSVDGVMRVSLAWDYIDDLDISIREPSGDIIYYGNKHSYRTSGTLDIDQNAGKPYIEKAVENITYPRKTELLTGTYSVFIKNFRKRTCEKGFHIEIEIEGTLWNLEYKGEMVNKEKVHVADIVFDGKQFTVKPYIDDVNKTVRTIYNIHTQSFVNVDMLLYSPNHWHDTKKVGNKHYFFILTDCKNPGKARGFFNEFLRNEFTKHRKVFELLGSKMKADYQDSQLSGIGFSSTVDNTVIFRVSGKTTKVVKVHIN